MRDGIYRVDFRSGRPEGKGIAMLRAGLFKGLDQDHGYTGNLEAAEGRVSGYITFRDYSEQTQESFCIRAETVQFKGIENPGGFEISGPSEAEPKTYKILATWIADL
jgi:hypothetical protein